MVQIDMLYYTDCCIFSKSVEGVEYFMRKKSITAFIGVYIALCIAYGVKGRMTAIPMDITETDNTEIVQRATETTVAFPTDGTAEKVQSEEKTTLNIGQNSVATEISTFVAQKEENTNIPTEIITETATVLQVTTEIPTENSYVGVKIEEQTEEQEELCAEAQIEPETEPVQNIPTLEEFLKNLRCSGCRHNCFLFSPRCMNGARKASQAESEYHEMYG